MFGSKKLGFTGVLRQTTGMTLTTPERLAASLRRMAVAVKLDQRERLLQEISFANDLVYCMHPEVARLWFETEEIIANERATVLG